MSGRATEITKSDSGQLIPYRRGIALRQVVKGALTRFLPGVVITFAGLTGLFPMRMSNDLSDATVLTLGFGLGLMGLRRWLYPDVKVGGAPSFLAGLLAPLALGMLLRFTRGWTTVQVSLFPALIGVVLAVLMFFAWLSPTPEHMRGDGFEGGQG